MFNPLNLAQNAGPAKDVASIIDGDNFLMEIKYDGFRLLVHVTEDGVIPYTRTGKAQSGKLPGIEAALSGLPADTWLDGELVAFDAKGMPEWGKVQSCMGANVDKAASRSGDLTLMVFDILSYDGLDIRPLSQVERRAALEVALPVGPYIRLTPQRAASDAYHEEIVAQGWEGTIVKDPSKAYASGQRGHGWHKLKANDELDCVIMGFKPGENSFTGMIGAIEFGQYKESAICPVCASTPAGQRWLCPERPHENILVSRGRCSGMNMKMRQEFTDHQEEYLGKVISLAYMGIMPSGSPRHPQWKRMRDDKLAEECVWT